MREEPFFSHIRLRRDELDPKRFPLSVPAVAMIDQIRFHPAVTVFAGENGSGKSTLVEAIALAAGFNAEGGRKSFRTESEATDNQLAEAISLARNPGREKDGYFLRGESAYVTMNYMNEIGASMHYGGNLHHRSHGESFMQIFYSRFQETRDALYILDEIESALSPQRQLEFLILMHEHIQRGSSFIISTHSPILMSYPKSRLYWLGRHGVEERHYRDTEHFRVYKGFIDRPDIVHKMIREKA